MIDIEPPLPALGSTPPAVAAREVTSGTKLAATNGNALKALFVSEPPLASMAVWWALCFAFFTGAAPTIDIESPLPALGSQQHTPPAVAAREVTSGG
jgi:hypothetical protein